MLGNESIIIKFRNNVIIVIIGQMAEWSKALRLGKQYAFPVVYIGVGSNPTLLSVFFGFRLVVGGRGGVFR